MENGSKQLVVVVGSNGEIVTFNRECEKVTGYRSAEVIGKNLIEQFVPVEWREVVIKRFKDATEQDLREPHTNPWLTKAGEQRMIEWSCSFIPSENGKIIVGFGKVRS